MSQLERLIEHVIARVNINLRKPLIDVGPYIRHRIPKEKFSLYYGFYSLTTHHPIRFRFHHSSLSGTYFLGKCEVNHSVLYKSDIRGDELKPKGTVIDVSDIKVTLHDDEIIKIRDSFLVKTLVHNSSHDLESVEIFKIYNTAALHYSNIHGTSIEGAFLEPFSTVDRSTCHDCTVGRFAYVQAGELFNKRIQAGRIWVKAEGTFEFNYQFDEKVLSKYISFDEDYNPHGIFIDFVEQREDDFSHIYSLVCPILSVEEKPNSSISPYALLKGECSIDENVLIAQRAYVESSSMGKGANAQENCYIINSVYEGLDVTAHGGKVLYCHLGLKVFIGFNSFLNGKEDKKIKVGAGSIVMPHTIIDAEEPIDIPDNSLVWGYIRNQNDLDFHSLSLDEVANLKGQFQLGNMTFEGTGTQFVKAFRHRIEHILEANGAYFDGSNESKGHAQKTQDISFNLIQPYPEGELKGMYPELRINPLQISDL